jgi:hypothetical protein
MEWGVFILAKTKTRKYTHNHSDKPFTIDDARNTFRNLDNPYSAQVLVTCPECRIANKFEHKFYKALITECFL